MSSSEMKTSEKIGEKKREKKILKWQFYSNCTKWTRENPITAELTK